MVKNSGKVANWTDIDHAGIIGHRSNYSSAQLIPEN
jgi:hypothetical protein